jgi:hypothetical protein
MFSLRNEEVLDHLRGSRYSPLGRVGFPGHLTVVISVLVRKPVRDTDSQKKLDSRFIKGFEYAAENLLNSGK